MKIAGQKCIGPTTLSIVLEVLDLGFFSILDARGLLNQDKLFDSSGKTLSDESIVVIEMGVSDFVSILSMDPLQFLLLYHPLFSRQALLG